MLRQIMFGGAVSLANIAVHALAMMFILRVRIVVHAKCAITTGASVDWGHDRGRFDVNGCASYRDWYLVNRQSPMRWLTRRRKAQTIFTSPSSITLRSGTATSFPQNAGVYLVRSLR